MKNWFHDIKTTIKIKLGRILEKLTQRHNRRESVSFDNSQDHGDNEICASTQFLQKQKHQLLNIVIKKIRESLELERYCNVLPVFGFNSAKRDLNLIKPFLLPIPVSE